MKDYIEILEKGDYQNYFPKYNIKVVMIPRSSSPGNSIKDIFLYGLLYNLFYQDSWKTINDKLIHDSWSIIYEDPTTVIYYKEIV